MRKLIIAIFCICILSISSACGRKTSAADTSSVVGSTTDTASLTPRYARGFTLKSVSSDLTLLTISDPESSHSESYRYALVRRGASPSIPEGFTPVDIPLRRVVCMTSLQLSNFIRLGNTSKVVGITSTRHLKNAVMRRQLANGTTSKIGIEGNFDNEVILALEPDAIFISPFKRGGYDALRDLDIPLIPHLGYKELSPLGQAEWMKVTGFLTGEFQKADAEFSKIEQNYLRLCHLLDTVSYRPTVFSGEMRGGNWYAVGGRSFLAQMFADAGADYFLKDNRESGGVTLDYETVFTNASDADYWRIVNSFDGEFSYDALRDLDRRYTDFKAWKKRGVIYCNMDDVPFYESMPVEPDILLADFIHIFHPAALPDHKPVYYHLLK